MHKVTKRSQPGLAELGFQKRKMLLVITAVIITCYVALLASKHGCGTFRSEYHLHGNVAASGISDTKATQQAPADSVNAYTASFRGNSTRFRSVSSVVAVLEHHSTAQAYRPAKQNVTVIYAADMATLAKLCTNGVRSGMTVLHTTVTCTYAHALCVRNNSSMVRREG